MAKSTTFPCPACGAPVEPVANVARMACPFCNTALEIPDDLRYNRPVKKNTHAGADPFAQARNAVTPEMQARSAQQAERTASFLRKAQPLASGAYRTYAWWTILRRFLPGCLIAVAVVCLLACIVGALMGYWLPKNW